jgi:hypothetical protein
VDLQGAFHGGCYIISDPAFYFGADAHRWRRGHRCNAFCKRLGL